MNRKEMKATVAQAVLDAARWKEDMAITNHYGERVWLCPSYNREGKRTGITDCCLVDDPCKHHAAIAAASTQQHPSDQKRGS